MKHTDLFYAACQVQERKRFPSYALAWECEGYIVRGGMVSRANSHRIRRYGRVRAYGLPGPEKQAERSYVRVTGLEVCAPTPDS